MRPRERAGDVVAEPEKLIAPPLELLRCGGVDCHRGNAGVVLGVAALNLGALKLIDHLLAARFLEHELDDHREVVDQNHHVLKQEADPAERRHLAQRQTVQDADAFALNADLHAIALFDVERAHLVVVVLIVAARALQLLLAAVLLRRRVILRQRRLLAADDRQASERIDRHGPRHLIDALLLQRIDHVVLQRIDASILDRLLAGAQRP